MPDDKGSGYSWVLIISMILTIIYLIYGYVSRTLNVAMRVVVDSVIVPVEASLMAILAVTLIYASIRLLSRRLDVMSVLFLVVAVLFLVAFMPTPFGQVPGDQFLAQFLNIFSSGGARGLLIGIGLGTLLTGLRVDWITSQQTGYQLHFQEEKPGD